MTLELKDARLMATLIRTDSIELLHAIGRLTKAMYLWRMAEARSTIRPETKEHYLREVVKAAHAVGEFATPEEIA